MVPVKPGPLNKNGSGSDPVSSGSLTKEGCCRISNLHFQLYLQNLEYALMPNWIFWVYDNGILHLDYRFSSDCCPEQLSGFVPRRRCSQNENSCRFFQVRGQSFDIPLPYPRN